VSQRSSLTRFDLRRTAFRFRDADLGSTPRCSTCKKNLILVEGKTLASILYSCHGSMQTASLLMPRRVDGAQSRYIRDTEDY